MELVAELLRILSLTPEHARIVGTAGLVAIVFFDVLGSGGNVPENTPRSWLIRLSQWRSPGCWNQANRQRAKKEGKMRFWLAPFQFLPATGAIVPFLFGAIIGHSFHPWSTPPFQLGIWGLVSVLLLGIAISVATFGLGRTGQLRGERLVVWIAALGVIAGVFLWPVY